MDPEEISDPDHDFVECLPSLPMPTKNTINAEILTVKMKTVGNSSYSPFYVLHKKNNQIYKFNNSLIQIREIKNTWFQQLFDLEYEEQVCPHMSSS